MNPILQKLNGQPINDMMGRMNFLSNMMSGMNPDVLFNQMMKTNPRFAQFVSENKGKSAEEIASNYGINPSMLNGLLGGNKSDTGL